LCAKSTTQGGMGAAYTLSFELVVIVYEGASIAIDDEEDREATEKIDGVDLRFDCRPKLELLEAEVCDIRFVSADDSEGADDCRTASSFGGGADQSWTLQRSWRFEPPSNFDSCNVVRTRSLPRRQLVPRYLRGWKRRMSPTRHVQLCIQSLFVENRTYLEHVRI
jgi:hypothetical protein